MARQTSKRPKKTVGSKSTKATQNAQTDVKVKAKKKSLVSKKIPLRKRLSLRINAFLARRPHRSFRLTKRRDYKRRLDLPGYIAFTHYVLSRIANHWKIFGGLALTYTVLAISLGTMTSQDSYNEISAMVQGVGGELITGNLSAIFQATAVSLGAFTSSSSLTDVQRMYVGIMIVLTWLTTVWLLREYMVGRTPRLRDGIYNSAAPLVSTVLVALWLLVQLLPIGLTAVMFSGLVSAGLFTNAFGAFIFAVLAILLISLSLYWMTGTFIALVVVTLPGMYPMRALQAAGDLVIGRRLRILYRIIWLLLVTAIFWIAIMVPAVVLDTWLQSKLDWMIIVPWVPVLASLLAATTVIWTSSYIYLLYRKVVDDDTSPA